MKIFWVLYRWDMRAMHEDILVSHTMTFHLQIYQALSFIYWQRGSNIQELFDATYFLIIYMWKFQLPRYCVISMQNCQYIQTIDIINGILYLNIYLQIASDNESKDSIT